MSKRIIQIHNAFNYGSDSLRDMSLSNAFEQVKCALTQHEVRAEDEDELFKNDNIEVPTYCAKCKAPILIKRESGETEFYYVSERNVIYA